MAIPWDDDPPESRGTLQQNLSDLLRGLAREVAERVRPTVQMAQEWHRRIFAGVRLPVDYYAGEIRDSDPRFPELIDYEVQIGSHRGVAADDVPAALERFEQQIQQAVNRLDEAIPVGEVPRDAGQLGSVVTLCALTHGEWIRIHPFANGNGRVARVWANWAALRYGLLPFVSLRPRPEGARYSRAAERSMLGDHGAAVDLFMEWIL